MSPTEQPASDITSEEGDRSAHAASSLPGERGSRCPGTLIAVRVRVEQTALPGIGVRHDIVTETGRRIGVVSHRDGRRDLILYDRRRPRRAAGGRSR